MDIAVQLASLGPASRPATASPLANLKPGQVILAQVLGASTGGATRVAIGNTTLELPLPGRPSPGTFVQVQVAADGLGARLQVLDRSPVGATTTAQTPTTRSTVALALLNIPPGPGRAAATEMMQLALGRQDSMSTLLSTLSQHTGTLRALPMGVESTGQRALAAVLNLNGRSLTGPALKTAVQQSGLFFEAMLAGGGSASTLRGDLKAALLSLNRALKPWTDGAPSIGRSPGTRPPPPSRDGLLAGHRTGAQVIPNTMTAGDLARALGVQAEAALARLRLSQIASLPQTAGQTGGTSEAAAVDWTFELPFLLGEEMSMAQFQIRRDGGSGKNESERTWQMRFAIDFEATGSVHAKLVLRRGGIAITLWAEREEMAAALSESMPDLRAALESRGLCVHGLTCRPGAPDGPTGPAGALMDRQT